MNEPYPSADGRTAFPPDGKADLSARVRALRLGDRLGGAKQSGRSIAWLPWTLCLMMAIAWVLIIAQVNREGGSLFSFGGGSGDSEAAEASPVEEEPADERPAAVGVEVLSAKGYIVPAHRISISPIEVSGRITKLTFVEGQPVKEGDLLAEIDSRIYKADLDEAEAMHKAAVARLESLKPRQEDRDRVDAELAESEARMEQARLEYERNRALGGGGALAERDYEEAVFGYRAAKERVRGLKMTKALLEPRQETIAETEADLAAAKARVERALVRFQYCRVLAPIDGTILTKQAEEGNLINPVVGGISTSLCDMADLTDLEVELDVQERDIPKVFAGQACEIRADAFPKRKYQGYVHRLMPIADRAKGVLPIRVKVIVPDEEQGEFLKPEMGALVTFFNWEAERPVR